MWICLKITIVLILPTPQKFQQTMLELRRIPLCGKRKTYNYARDLIL